MGFDAPLTACRLCGSSAVAPYDADFRGLTISRCAHCGVRFLNPQYDDAFLSRFYGQYIPEPHGDDAADYSLQAPLHHYHFSLIERFASPGRFLSVGCGSGVELQVARERGWDPEGYDVDPGTVARVSAALGVPIVSGRFADVSFSQPGYECVYLHHVLEHVKDPASYLRRIRELLAPRGVMFVACPNIGSISNRAKTAMGRLGLKSQRGKHYDTWHHLYYFEPRQLGHLLAERFGFEVLGSWNGVRRADRRDWMPRTVRLRLNDWLPLASSIFLLLARKSG